MVKNWLIRKVRKARKVFSLILCVLGVLSGEKLREEQKNDGNW